MTGLDPEQHVLLEIATVITNNDLQIVAEGPILAIARLHCDKCKKDYLLAFSCKGRW